MVAETVRPVMRKILRAFGIFLLCLAIVVGVKDLYQWYQTNDFTLTDLGSFWYSFHPNSLQLLEPAVTRYLNPFLWDPIFITVLLYPATSVFGLPGLLLVLLTRDKTRPGKRDLYNG